MMQKLLIVTLSLAIFILLATECKAGPFLDLDVGTHLRDWPGQACEFTHTDPNTGTAWCKTQGVYLGEKNPLGLIRVGYRMKPVKGKHVSVAGHVYFEHVSSIPDSRDNGLNIIMFGIRIE